MRLYSFKSIHINIFLIMEITLYLTPLFFSFFNESISLIYQVKQNAQKHYGCCSFMHFFKRYPSIHAIPFHNGICRTDKIPVKYINPFFSTILMFIQMTNRHYHFTCHVLMLKHPLILEMIH